MMARFNETIAMVHDRMLQGEVDERILRCALSIRLQGRDTLDFSRIAGRHPCC